MPGHIQSAAKSSARWVLRSTLILFTSLPAVAQLSGTYGIHDLFAQLNGEGWVRYGTRTFQTATGQIQTVLTNGEIPFFTEDFVIESTRTFSVDGRPVWGTFTSDGAIAIESLRVAPSLDTTLPNGYAALRVSVRTTSPLNDASFTGDYSYQALTSQDNGNWRAWFGAVDSNGQGDYTLAANNLVTNHIYDVTSAGPTRIDGDDDDLATLTSAGDILFRSIEADANDDPRLLFAHVGLAMYVRRSTNSRAADFQGTYRVHELRVRSNRIETIGVGQVVADGTGDYAGTIERAGDLSTFSGSIAVNATGTFRFNGSGNVEGTMSPRGAMLVITDFNGQVIAGVSGETWMQLWVRIVGGGPSDTDTDGDGLTDDEEEDLGTDPDDPDTDNDGLNDGIDPDPLIRNDIMSVTPADLDFLKVVTQDGPAAQTLAVSGSAHPLFAWTATPSDSWIQVTPESGSLDGVVSVEVDTTDFTPEGSPYTGAIEFESPQMSNSPFTVDVTLTVAYPAPEIVLDPDSLSFHAYAGSVNPDTQTINISNALLGPLEWIATPLHSYVTVTPPSGDGPGDVEISIDITGLEARMNPYLSGIEFTAVGAEEIPVTLPLRIQIDAARELNDPFPIFDDGRVQSGQSVMFELLADRYVVAWIANLRAYASILDNAALPLRDGIALSSLDVGSAASSAAAAIGDAGEVWVTWENSFEGADYDLLGRAIDLNSTDDSPTFPLIAGASDDLAPRFIANGPEGDVLAVYRVQGAVEDLRFARFDPATNDPTLNINLTANDGTVSLGEHAAAYDGDRAELLVVYWSRVDADPWTLLARRSDAATGDPIGAPVSLPLPGASAGLTSVHVDAIFVDSLDQWAVLAGAAPTGVWLTRFDAGTTPASFVTLVVSENANTEGVALGYSPDGEQFAALFSVANASVVELRGARVTAGGQLLRTEAALAPSSGDQFDPRVTHNPNDNEFLAVWQEDTGLNPLVYGMRLPGGSADEDDDGLPNDWELTYGLDPFSALGDNGPDGDPDEDGLANFDELAAGTDPTTDDTDGDGLGDGREDLNGNGRVDASETDPVDADSDSDGFNDGAEALSGSDANYPVDVPETGIYLIDYGRSREGVTQPVRIGVVVDSAALFALSVNAPDGSGVVAPAGWIA
ncbi:MAG: hypothetical protein AAB353_00190, partial [Candidatus Hydrogenedentota bacterium]